MVSNALLKKVAEDLSVLCVEDNDELRNELLETLGYFFKKVEGASNGLEAIEKIGKEPFDVIITDIKMPQMNGIEFIKKTKNNNTKSQFIVISAHGNDKDLFELLELGVSKFIPKPLSSQILKLALYEVCRNLYDFNISQYYLDILEKANLELTSKVNELEKTKAILEVKIEQINQLHSQKIASTESNKYAVPTNIVVEDDFALSPDDIDEIIELETNMDSSISLAIIGKHMDRQQIRLLAKQLQKYAVILKGYIPLANLSSAIEKLSATLETNTDRVESMFERIMLYMESISFVLVKWRENIVSRQMHLQHFDASLTSDIEMIISIIDGKSVKTEDIELF